MSQGRQKRARIPILTAGLALLAALPAALLDAPFEARATEPPRGAVAAGYELGPETVPNGNFDKVGPNWQRLRPDEGEKLAVIPEGWLVGYQGGERKMPIPGRDPETGNRCMVFLYGAGRVDLFAPSFPLDGPGTYLLSMRTRSVVNPSRHALRALVRLIGEGAGAEGRSAAVEERDVAAGPGRAVWRQQTALLEIPPGVTHAELHLVKNDRLADFLVDDVSLRRIIGTPDRRPLEAVPEEGAWLSPVVFLGPVARATVEIRETETEAPAWTVRARTGATAIPGAAWTDWRPLGDPVDGRGERPLPLLAKGIGLYAQVRLALHAPLRDGDGRRPPEDPVPMEIRSVPWAGEPLSPEVSIRTVFDGTLPEGGPEAVLTLPPATACTEGELRPVRRIALAATAGVEGDLPRARAIVAALDGWMPFARRDESPSNASLDPVELLEDCRRPTPLHCDPEWRRDLSSAACRCLGMVCRPVTLHPGPGASASIPGLEVWSNEENRWIFLPIDEPGDRKNDRLPAASGGVLAGADAPPSAAAMSAAALASRSGGRLEVATDLRWGHRGWVDFDPGRGPQAEDDLTRRASLPAGEIEVPLNQVRLHLETSGERSLAIRLENSMTDFAQYLHRFSRFTSWKPAQETLFWNLAPGENLLEVRAAGPLGALGPIATVRVHVRRDPGARFRAYEGLRPLGGDPHVHTGLALYRLLDPESPLATGSPESVFASAVQNGLHWAAVTDYSGHIDDPRSLEWRSKRRNRLTLPDGSRTRSEWEHLKGAARDANEPGRFAAFVGVEFDGGGFSSKGGTGRKIILLPDEGPPGFCSPLVHNVGDCPVVEDAYRYTRENGGVMIAATPCPASGGEDSDWSRHDPIVALLEIYGGACERAPGGLVDVTSRRGLLVGTGGGSKDMTGTAGTYDRTICWAEEITRPSILAAMRERRCYWSAAGHLDLAFTVNDAPMGSVAAPDGSTAWSVLAESSTAPAFHDVEVIRDGQVIASATCETASRCFLEGGLGEAAPGVYYAAVSDAEGNRLAVSSPVFLIRSRND